MSRTTLALILFSVDCAVAGLCFRLLPVEQALTAALALVFSTCTVLLLAPSKVHFRRDNG